MSNKINTKIVTRFAPSPTGFMHVGGIRTALYSWAYAKKNNGIFILRIEDTDKEREVEGSIDHIIESLKWLGINWSQGPILQSERLDIYKKYAEKLIKKGHAYVDPYTKKEVEVFRKKSEEEKKPFLYRDYRPLSTNASQGGLENPPKWDGIAPLRFKANNIKRYEWNDLVFGNLSAGEEALDDFILMKGDGYPTYNFAHIVDDIEMGVTHVMRGQEFISSTPKFLSLYEALEVKPPFFVTLPPIMGVEGKKKLGKRDGAKDVLEYRNEGYLSEAIVNFLSLIGWNPGTDQEVFNQEEFVQMFDISKIGHSGGQFNEEKLDWINKEHIKKLSEEDLEKYVFNYLSEELKIKKIVPLIIERISKFNDIKEMVEKGELDFFYKKPKYEIEKLIYKDTEINKTIDNIKIGIEAIETISENNFNKDNIKIVLMELADKLENRGQILHPIRYALSGKEKSPDPFILIDVLGKEEVITRLNQAIQILSKI